MKLQTLSEYLRPAWRVARAAARDPELLELPARDAFVEVARDTWGLDDVRRRTELHNLAAWAWTARDRAVVHTVRPSVPRLVAATDLHQLPDAPPRLLTSPWCVEVGRVDRGERLWGETFALAGYQIDGVHYFVGFEGPGCRVVPWRPRWSGRDLGAGLDTTVIDEAQAEMGVPGWSPGSPEHAAWALQAVRWATVYGLLLDAAGAPVRVTEEAPEPRDARSKAKASEARDWSCSRVTLTPDGDRFIASSAPSPTEAEAARARCSCRRAPSRPAARA